MIKGYFLGLHPAVSFTYFAAVIGMTLACMHPVLSPLSFLGAARLSGLPEGMEKPPWNHAVPASHDAGHRGGEPPL